MDCRAGCGACCIAPSITTPIPGMPDGKPAGVRCVQLTADQLCALFGKPERPAVCNSLRPSAEMCGTSSHEALVYLGWLDRVTAPAEALYTVAGLARALASPANPSASLRPARAAASDGSGPPYASR